MNNPVNWFDLATTDLERAKQFYTSVFDASFQRIDMPESSMYMFNGGPELPGAVGALVASPQNKPSQEGTIVYFGVKDANIPMARVEEAGGSIVFPKTSIGEFGFIAQFIDSEGNRVGVHSHE